MAAREHDGGAAGLKSEGGKASVEVTIGFRIISVFRTFDVFYISLVTRFPGDVMKLIPSRRESDGV